MLEQNTDKHTPGQHRLPSLPRTMRNRLEIQQRHNKHLAPTTRFLQPRRLNLAPRSRRTNAKRHRRLRKRRNVRSRRRPHRHHNPQQHPIFLCAVAVAVATTIPHLATPLPNLSPLNRIPNDPIRHLPRHPSPRPHQSLPRLPPLQHQLRQPSKLQSVPAQRASESVFRAQQLRDDGAGQPR